MLASEYRPLTPFSRVGTTGAGLDDRRSGVKLRPFLVPALFATKMNADNFAVRGLSNLVGECSSYPLGERSTETHQRIICSTERQQVFHKCDGLTAKQTVLDQMRVEVCGWDVVDNVSYHSPSYMSPVSEPLVRLCLNAASGLV